MLFYKTPTPNAAYFDLGLSVFLFLLLIWLLMSCLKSIGTLRRHLTQSSLRLVLSDLVRPSFLASVPCVGVLGFFWYRFLAFLSYINALDVGAIGFVVIFGVLSFGLVYFSLLFGLSVLYGQSLFPTQRANPKQGANQGASQ